MRRLVRFGASTLPAHASFEPRSLSTHTLSLALSLYVSCYVVGFIRLPCGTSVDSHRDMHARTHTHTNTQWNINLIKPNLIYWKSLRALSVLLPVSLPVAATAEANSSAAIAERMATAYLHHWHSCTICVHEHFVCAYMYKIPLQPLRMIS